MKSTKLLSRGFFLIGVTALALLLLTIRAAAVTLFSDDFNDGNANGWTVINDSGKAPNWQVVGGEYNQLNGSVGAFSGSFHRGSYSPYANGFGFTNYEVSVDVTPVGGGSHGVMFRYKDNDNYYRFSISQTQGFSRLERKLNGAFKTLASDGRGPLLNQTHNITVIANGPRILVYLDGVVLFGATDSGISSGTVALYTQSNAKFDNVVVHNNISAPRVVVSNPVSHFVETSGTLAVAAVATNVPSGGKVKFLLDGGTASLTDPTDPYSGQFTNLSQGDHTVEALVLNSSGQTLVQDKNAVVGARGNFFVALGDSITNGQGDNVGNDDNSADGRNLSRGFTPVLNDMLSAILTGPVTVMNEGLGGTKSGSGPGHGVSRVNSTKARHPESKYWLILFGTNDSSGSLPVMSGMNCTEADLQARASGCVGTYKDNMRTIIKNLQGSGKVALLAKVPFILNVPVNGRDKLVRDYNTVVDQLVIEQNIPVIPPDFYTYFKNHQNEFSDDLHPNGAGYKSMANLWFNALMQSGILP